MHLFIFTWYHCGAINSKFLSHDFLWLRGPCFAVVNVSNSLLVLISQKIDPEKALRFWEISIGNNPGKHNGETRETEEAREAQNMSWFPLWANRTQFYWESFEETCIPRTGLPTDMKFAILIYQIPFSLIKVCFWGPSIPSISVGSPARKYTNFTGTGDEGIWRRAPNVFLLICTWTQKYCRQIQSWVKSMQQDFYGVCCTQQPPLTNTN